MATAGQLDLAQAGQTALVRAVQGDLALGAQVALSPFGRIELPRLAIRALEPGSQAFGLVLLLTAMGTLILVGGGRSQPRAVDTTAPETPRESVPVPATRGAWRTLA